ncbi:MAG TPA: sugar phosphate isomerase/epimerase [Gaiellales bacterium]|nr:sugar phosphate isomerase/epimerase [Gaiellales bacterium]
MTSSVSRQKIRDSFKRFNHQTEHHLRIGVFNDGLAHLSREEAFAWCAVEGLEAIEMGVGGWAKAPEQLPLDLMLRELGERDRLQGQLAEHGLALSCVNAAGNPLHPDPAIAGEHAARLRGAIELAALLGVERVVTMSGCPGGRRGGGEAVFAPWAVAADDESLWNWQFEQVVAPFWRELGEWARAAAPSVRICLELHAGALAYNPGSFRRVAEAGGENIRVNFDPSHFWWQGIDARRVVDELGDRISFCHGKDTLLHPDRIAVDGVFDFRFPVDPDTATWHFAAVGEGRPVEEWAQLLAALRAAGYDGDVSIEQEDPRYAAEDGIRRSHAAIVAALDQVAA